MKKTLVVAALVVASILPTLPASAASMMMKPMASAAAMMKPMAMPKMDAVPAYCFFLPLLPKCVDAWKAEMDAMKMTKK